MGRNVPTRSYFRRGLARKHLEGRRVANRLIATRNHERAVARMRHILEAWRQRFSLPADMSLAAWEDNLSVVLSVKEVLICCAFCGLGGQSKMLRELCSLGAYKTPSQVGAVLSMVRFKLQAMMARARPAESRS